MCVLEQAYKGIMVDTGEVVEVQRSLDIKYPEIADFSAQIRLLTKLKHNNVLGYIGFCYEKGESILVFEDMPNDSLDKWLFGDERKVNLTWAVRQNICLGAANGIQYLHSLAQPRIIHCGIKSSSFFFNKTLEPKVANFELVFLLPDDESEIIVNQVRGTKGYLAPEFVCYGQLSQKVDVFSFGVVLLEIVSGRRSLDSKLPEDQYILRVWALKLHNEGRSKELIDPTLDRQPDEEIEAVRIIKIALLCVRHSPEERPDMSLVVAMLQENLDA